MITKDQLTSLIAFADMCIAKDVNRDTFYRNARQMVEQAIVEGLMHRPDTTPKAPGPSKGAKKFTDADRIAILRRVKALRTSGMLRDEAIEACGTNRSSFELWQGKYSI